MNMLAFIGTQELMVILIVVLILFGARKIPEFARGLGQGIREFRKASREIQEEIERAAEESPPNSAQHSSTPTTSPEPGYAEPDLHADTYPDGTSSTEESEGHGAPQTSNKQKTAQS